MSEGFSADWLRLREPHDLRARNAHLLADLGAWCASRSHLRVLDLGSGTGGNLRRTAPELHVDQAWTLIELDPALIAAGQRQVPPARVGWRYRQLDLQRDLEQLGDEPCELITASALLDLVSADWLDRLVALRTRMGAALYLTLTYAGGVRWSPADPLDAMVAELVDRHQRLDKGFGPALGPTAGEALHATLRGAGCQVRAGSSDWNLNREDQAIQRALLAGYVHAASDVSPVHAREIVDWAERRLEIIDRGGSSLRVAHADHLVLPA